ncbi:MAG: acetyl-CoA carboxylase biotin carboxylase subunit [Chloroflexi bacterium]|nr:acetyl-CoA carboxylase biotin carboxylase subunit [Chloroflexota bacterium]
MFKKILVANRGEIAVRVMRACKEMGIATVAVYSEADKDALFVRYADEAFEIGPPMATESYLRMDKVLEVVQKTGAEAVHPGYGLLAENARFVEACEKAGIKFIGPSSKAMAALGDKLSSKALVTKVNVPTTPGTDAITSPEMAHKAAKEIGYPILIKASAGGGGLGMQIVENEAEMGTLLELAQSTAKASFGDGTVYLEKYHRQPHHIEIQFIADEHGNCVHLCERECSVQRRHQKLIEESPSPVITPEVRAEMGAATVRAARAAGYTNAGTAEYLFADGHFYFNEVNARLQVEHPITEMVTGVDLVKEQIRVAAGLPLQFKQEDIRQSGWAIECRICAEDPLENFIPTPDKVKNYRSPGGIGIRVDSGIYTGYTIPAYYDSLVSKLCAWGRDRDEAIGRMKRALFEYVLEGPVTNIPFHLAVLENEVFRKGDYSTKFIPEHPEIMYRTRHIIDQNIGLKIKGGSDAARKAAIAAAVIEDLLVEEAPAAATQSYSGWSWQSKLDYMDKGW